MDRDDRLLADLATGSRGAVLALPFSSAPGTPLSYGVTAGGAGPGGDAVVTGTVPGVAAAGRVDVLLVPTATGLYAVDALASGVDRAPVVSLDATRPLCDVHLSAAPGRLVAGPERSRGAVEDALVAGAALLASEQVGVAEWCLETTVSYLRDRRQFGRQVGSFQALKHRLADLWVALTQARAVARYAAACLAERGADAPVAAALAQAYCGPVAVTAAEEGVQLHGGIGFTWEHPAHLYLKRAKSASIAYGTASRHRAVLATLIDLPL